MRKYRITAFVGLDTHTKVIEAKNSIEANDKALAFGYEKSGHGSKFLQGVRVSPVKGEASKPRQKSIKPRRR